ncbi:hypothetical protein E2C01_021652 [Portunus trituberculatus]|uniref:Uncharacterized protein n=1 Tax=Portunus trituberculatus TaxID=210409 RepID=A0A5B7E5H9_PORTR|nr:hypothetical protein [Portunus trituberculatus]
MRLDEVKSDIRQCTGILHTLAWSGFRDLKKFCIVLRYSTLVYSQLRVARSYCSVLSGLR